MLALWLVFACLLLYCGPINNLVLNSSFNLAILCREMWLVGHRSVVQLILGIYTAVFLKISRQNICLDEMLTGFVFLVLGCRHRWSQLGVRLQSRKRNRMRPRAHLARNRWLQSRARKGRVGRKLPRKREGVFLLGSLFLLRFVHASLLDETFW